jgi:hypothetical protein
VWRQRYPDVPVPRLRYWVIFNNQLVSPPSTVQPTWPSVIGRSVEMAIRYSTITSLRHMFTLAELRNMQGQVIEVRVVAIPPEWRAPKPGVFVKETMDDLADIGEKLGRDPASWMTELP